MHQAIDPFDPNFLTFTTEFRIYGDDRESVWAFVDEIDYQWAIRWRWNPKCERGRVAPYLRRAVGGGRIQGFRQPVYTLYLHIEVMKRTGIIAPSKRHTIVDHRDGDSLNCRRSNLRWATPEQNGLNRFGNRALALWD